MAENSPGLRLNPRQIVGVMALLLVAATMGFWTWQSVVERLPLSQPTSYEEALGQLQTERFDRMDKRAQLAFLMKTSELMDGLTFEQRREEIARAGLSTDMRLKLWVAREFNNARKLADLKDPQQRARFLDEQIDRQIARFRERTGVTNGSPFAPPYGATSSFPSQERQLAAEFYEQDDPQQARVNEDYRAAYIDRVHQRGLDKPIPVADTPETPGSPATSQPASPPQP